MSTLQLASEVVLHDLAAIGSLVAQRRTALGLTLDEASQKLGVGRRLLSELEQGHRSVRSDTVLRILNLLGYDLVARARFKTPHA